MGAELRAELQFPADPQRVHILWRLWVYGYLWVKPESTLVIPFHTIDGSLEVSSYKEPVGLFQLSLLPKDKASGAMDGSNEQLTAQGPGRVKVSGRALGPRGKVTIADEITAKITLRSREIEHPITIDVELRGEEKELGKFTIGNWLYRVYIAPSLAPTVPNAERPV